MEETSFVRWRIYFSGTVQHVGFRYTAYYLARGLYLTGWVDNLPDGRVVLEAQGRVSQVRKLLKKDVDFLDHAQAEMSTARQFLFLMRCKNLKPEQVFEASNRVEKTISEQGFEVRRMKKDEIKRFLAIFFEASMSGDAMPDSDGEQYFEREEDDA